MSIIAQMFHSGKSYLVTNASAAIIVRATMTAALLADPDGPGLD